MAKAKLDGVVEAIRYKPDGEMAWARAYERRGAIYSDHVLLTREQLVQRLKSGKNFSVGSRVPQKGGTFEISMPLRLVQANGKDVLVTGEGTAERDSLKGIPAV